MAHVKEVLEPPNGRWGWMVVFGACLINAFNQSLLSVFGLLFGAFFSTRNESETRIALVMNLCSAFLNLTGLVTAPLMRNFSSRQIALFGTFLTSSGLMLSSISSSLPQIIFTYSFMVGSGLGLIGPAIFMVLSSYFTTKRSRALGFAMAGTGFGQMILPQVVRYLLAEFGFQGTVLIIGSLSLHGVIGATLFHPVEWHMKKVEVDNSETALLLRHPSSSSSGSSYIEPDYVNDSFWRRLVHSMDLSLLKDFRFLILSFGLSCAYAVSVDVSLILPFFLQETAQLNRSQTAICMSILAGFDLLSRLTFHLFTDRLDISHRSIFMIATLTLGVVRSILAEATTYTSLIIICAFYGYVRALVVVNQLLTISEFCLKWCPEKLPGALGLNMILKGISVLTIGPIFGLIRDITNSFNFSFHAHNILLSIAMIVWITELTFKRL